MDNKTTYSTGGVSVCTVLGIIFLILKLIGVADWPWWLVLLPFIVEVGFAVLIILIVLLIVIIKEIRGY